MKRLLLLFALLTVTAAPAAAQMPDPPARNCRDCAMYAPGMGGGMGMGMGMDRMGEMMGMCLTNADKIGLSADQVKKITPIHREMQKMQVRFKADLKLAEMDLADIVNVKDFDLEKADAAVKKIGDMKTAHHLAMLAKMKEARSILTDEQFKKMKALMSMKKGTMPGKGMKRRR